MFGDVAARLLSLLWETTWQGALFAVCVAASCVLFRVSAAHRAWLWLLVCLKFVLSFAWLLCFGSTHALSIPLPWQFVPATDASPVTETNNIPLFVALTAWGVGATLGIAWLVTRAKVTADAVRSAVPRSDRSLRDMLTAIGMRLGLMPRRIPSVRETYSTHSSPQVTLWRANPVIVFPRHLLAPSQEALSPEELRFVLAHELAHVRRGDLWIGLLFAVAQALFFFHPCIYWARHEWEAAREEACDALALRVCGTDTPTAPAQYGALLLRLGNGQSHVGIPSAGMATSPFAGLRRRLRYLETWQQSKGTDKPSFWRLAVTAPLLAVFFAPLRLQPVQPVTQAVATPLPVSPVTPAVTSIAPVAKSLSAVSHPKRLAVASAKSRRPVTHPRAGTPRPSLVITKPVAPPAPRRVQPAPQQKQPVTSSPMVAAKQVSQAPQTVSPPPTVQPAKPTTADTPPVVMAESLPSNAVVIAPQPTPTPRLSRSLVASTPTASPTTTPDTKPSVEVSVSITPPGISAAESFTARPVASEPAASRPARNNTATGENARPVLSFPLPQPSPSPSPLPLNIPSREPNLPNPPRR